MLSSRNSDLMPCDFLGVDILEVKNVPLGTNTEDVSATPTGWLLNAVNSEITRLETGDTV